jgi:uncharacterized protein YggU (UPF0235/DUF167 family)
MRNEYVCQSIEAPMYIKVRVKANARAESVVQESHDHYVISVKEKAERNLANKRIIEILKSMFARKTPSGVEVPQIRIIHGHKGPSKLIAVDQREDE